MSATAVECADVTVRYGDVIALRGVSVAFDAGRIHAVVGQNGAGKTTFARVCAGIVRPTSGSLTIAGAPVPTGDVGAARACGVELVHQSFALPPSFTVAEAMEFGSTLRDGPVYSRRALERRWRDHLASLDVAARPGDRIRDLPVETQQGVEIARALVGDARVLILDEPTAVLTPGESEELFTILRALRADGRSVIFISHKLKEVQAIADTVTVIRGGKVVGRLEPTASDAEMAEAMVGRSVRLTVDKGPSTPGEVALAVRGLSVAGDTGGRAVDGVDLEVRRGEIVGVAGVQGNGQTELCEALLGLRRTLGGTLEVGGRDLTGASTRDVLAAGVGYVPEDRQADGLVGDFSIVDNLALDVIGTPGYSKGLSLRIDDMRRSAERQIAEFDVRTRSAEAAVRTLSGGNQQKVILARELSRPLVLLVASQPTRGLDIGSIEFVHRRIVEARDGGAGVLIVSSELDEIYALADRIVVMSGGRIAGERTPDVDRRELGMLMAGAGGAS